MDMLEFSLFLFIYFSEHESFGLWEKREIGIKYQDGKDDWGQLNCHHSLSAIADVNERREVGEEGRVSSLPKAEQEHWHSAQLSHSLTANDLINSVAYPRQPSISDF